MIARNIPDGREFAFDGDVKMKQGDTTLTCDHLVIVYSESTKTGTAWGSGNKFREGMENGSQIKCITASGNVMIVQKERTTVAGKIIYDNATDTITIME